MNRIKSLTMLWLTVTLFSFNTIAFAKEAAKTYTEPTTEMQFVLIPGGTFTMGKETDQFSRPAHQVTIKPFYMGKYEVTFKEYAKFVVDTGSQMPDDNSWGRGIRPVINVNWHDATNFANWLSRKSGKTYRLPTEAEWEYAARAGTTTHFSWGDDLSRAQANCRGCGSSWDNKMTAAVGSFSANPFGLYDMSGNVYEWLLDTEHQSYEGAPTDGSAWIDNKTPDFRMTRGGSWNTRIIDVTTWQRCWDKDNVRSNNIGFRLVLEK